MSRARARAQRALVELTKLDHIKQADMAFAYAWAMNTPCHVMNDTGWGDVNGAIVDRWSQPGLVEIKRQAHLLSERTRAAFKASAVSS